MKSPNIMNFTVGATAGLCAAILPRLVGILTVPNVSDDVEVITPAYIVASILFALIIGVVTAIFEWGVRETPKHTFMAALGIPALLAGAFNTAIDANQLQRLDKTKSELNDALSEASGISTTRAEPRRKPPISESLRIISSAHAANSDRSKKVQWNLGIQIREARYVIVLDQAPTEGEAQQKAERLRATLPEVEVVLADDNRFLVIRGGGPRTKSEALLEAIRIKNSMGITPSLMEIK